MSRRVALLIANGNYIDNSLPALSTPASDARSLARVLRDRRIGAFGPVDILLDQDLMTVRKAVSRVLRDKARDDLVLLYFSGHGLRDEQGQLCLAVRDTETEDLHATTLRADFVSQAMDLSGSRRKVLILDCCNSGAVLEGSKDARPHTMNTRTSFRGSETGCAILTATDGVHPAWDGGRFMGSPEESVFTNYLVEGLETGAAKKRDDPEGIRLEEAFEYAREQTLLAGTGQSPRKWIFLTEGEEIFLTRPRATAAGLFQERDATTLAEAAREAEERLRQLQAQLQDLRRRPRAIEELREMKKTGGSWLASRAARILARHFEERGKEARRYGEASDGARFFRQALDDLGDEGKELPLLKLRLAVWLWKTRIAGSMPERLSRSPIRQAVLAALALLVLLGAGWIAAWVASSDHLPSKKIVNTVGMELVLLPRGSFVMGSNHDPLESPPHEVILTRPFYLARYEVTKKQWFEVTGRRRSDSLGDDYPKTHVSWNET